jgi:hypothetical protein
VGSIGWNSAMPGGKAEKGEHNSRIVFAFEHLDACDDRPVDSSALKRYAGAQG